MDQAGQLILPAGSAAQTARSQARLERVTLAVENMNCGGCMGKIERRLAEVPGVVDARANLSAKRVSVEVEPGRADAAELIDALAGAGYRAAELTADMAARAGQANRELLPRVGVAGFAAANVMLLSVSVWAGAAGDMDAAVQGLFHWLSALIALPAIAYAGQPFFRSARQALAARRLNMDVPISLAVVLAAAMSLYQTAQGSEQVYFDASVTLLFFLLIGRWLDQNLRSRAQGAAQNLLALKADTATVVAEDGTTRRCSAQELTVGMHVLVAAGERVPVDGLVRAGRSDLDEGLITGETAPRTIEVGDLVYAGTLNLTGPLQVETRAADDDTLLADIARLMETAEQAKGRYVRLADRAARIYAPAVHLLGAATFMGWLALGAGWEQALTTAIAVLIITCPCALALAVPAVQVAAASRLFHQGVIVKVADGLERLAEIDTVVFDKTGTLTLGRPRLVDADGIDDRTLARAAALGAASRHPYAQAVVEAARARGLPVQPTAGVAEHPGAGLLRRVDGVEERLGSAAWCGESAGATAPASLYFVRGGGPAAAFRFEDRVRPDARPVISGLERLGLQVELLSGDRPEPVEAAADESGIQTWRARQRPDQKIARLDTLKRQSRNVLMVGDGLNDAPSLAAGHASLSPATAVDISQSASDAIFQGERLAPVLQLVSVARAAKRMALQNFAIAAAYNAVCIPIAMAGWVTPLIAAVAMSASSILVTANALRLRTLRLGEMP
ncbi:MAG: heavy metal translocating P-type ATPase [Methyloligellaceae bacterium]